MTPEVEMFFLSNLIRKVPAYRAVLYYDYCGFFRQIPIEQLMMATESNGTYHQGYTDVGQPNFEKENLRYVEYQLALEDCDFIILRVNALASDRNLPEEQGHKWVSSFEVFTTKEIVIDVFTGLNWTKNPKYGDISSRLQK